MPEKFFKRVVLFVLIALASLSAAAIDCAHAEEKQGSQTVVAPKNIEKELQDERRVNYAILKENAGLKQSNENLEKKLQNVKQDMEAVQKKDPALEKPNKDLEKNLQSEKQNSETLSNENSLLQKANKSLEEKLLKEQKNSETAANQNFSLKKTNKDLQAQLQAEKKSSDGLKKEIKRLAKRQHGYSVLQTNYNELTKTAESLKQDNAQLVKENRKITKQDSLILEHQRVESASLNKELGTAYTQTRNYDLAIDAYKKSLESKPNDAEVHYNLGLLYKQSKNDSNLAVFHLKRYLALNPGAVNKKDVQYLIEMISSKN